MLRPEDDLKDVFVVLEPPPGGLTKFRARREARGRAWAWALGCAVATAAALIVALRVTPAPRPERAPVDLIAGVEGSTLHPRWIGLGKVAPPREALTLAPELAGVLAARRVATEDPEVVFYMLDAK
jgi:hypothetical protein